MSPELARPLYGNERLPPLTLSHSPLAYASSSSSPRVNSISSASSSTLGSHSSFTSAASSNGPKTPGPLSPALAPCSTLLPPYGQSSVHDQYNPAMNGAPSEMYYQSHMPGASHMSAGQAPPPPAVTSPYSHTHQHPHQHQHQHPHSQPPLLPPGPSQYPPQYGSQYYTNGMASPAGPQMGASQPVLPPPGVPQPGMATASYTPGYDTSGQLAPPGMKPRVTATLWEDEGSLCFQVEARGICVARREGAFRQLNLVNFLSAIGLTRLSPQITT